MKIKLVKEIIGEDIKSYLSFEGIITHAGAEPVDLIIPLEDDPLSLELMFEHLSILTAGNDYSCYPSTGEEY